VIRDVAIHTQIERHERYHGQRASSSSAHQRCITTTTTTITAAMDTCPTELHSYICELACTDDGRTARSLSQLSTYFRAVSEPFRYQSLVLCGPAPRVLSLVSRLRTRPPHVGPVRHLFLSDTDPTSTPTSTSTALADAIHALLLTTSPTLETLALCAPRPAHSTLLTGALLGLPFPRLLELTVLGFYPFPRVPGGMPRLARLHLAGNRNPHGLLQMGALDAACPRLTHLRVSGLCMALSFVEELEEALAAGGKGEGGEGEGEGGGGREGGGGPQAVFQARLPPKLKCLLVQPAPPAPSFFRSHGVWEKMEAAMMMRLARLTGGAGAGGVRYGLLDRSVRETSCERVRRDWAERLDGGEGCWISGSDSSVDTERLLNVN
jgi:hypothetical protein